MPRFVILEHDHPFRHWDFLLETAGVLKAWRLLEEPERGHAVAAEPLPDHRLMYLDYEGPISGNRGRVIRWDAGTFEWARDGEDGFGVTLLGAKVRGNVDLRRETADWTWNWI